MNEGCSDGTWKHDLFSFMLTGRGWSWWWWPHTPWEDKEAFQDKAFKETGLPSKTLDEMYDNVSIENYPLNIDISMFRCEPVNVLMLLSFVLSSILIDPCTVHLLTLLQPWDVIHCICYAVIVNSAMSGTNQSHSLTDHRGTWDDPATSSLHPIPSLLSDLLRVLLSSRSIHL